MVVIAVCGSRSFTDYARLEMEIKNRWHLNDIDGIYVGGKGTKYPDVPQVGAAELAHKFAKKYGITCVVIEPDWDKYGKRAGPLHMPEIIDPVDSVIAFWDGSSPGTKGEIDYAKRHNKLIDVVLFSNKKIGK